MKKRCYQLIPLFILVFLIGNVSAQLPTFLPIGNHFQTQWVPGNSKVTIVLEFVDQNTGDLNTYASRGTVYFGSYQDYKNYVLMKNNKLLLLAKNGTTNSVPDTKYYVNAIINGKEYDFNADLGNFQNVQSQSFAPSIPYFEQVVISNCSQFVMTENGVQYNLLSNGVAIISGDTLAGLSRARYLVTFNGQTGVYTQTGDLLVPPVVSMYSTPLSVTAHMTMGSDTTIEMSTDLVNWKPFEYFPWCYGANNVSVNISDWFSWYYGNWYYYQSPIPSELYFQAKSE